MLSNFIFLSEVYFSNFSKEKLDKIISIDVFKKSSSFSKKLRSLKLKGNLNLGFENSK